MSWIRSPMKLYIYSGIALLFVRLVFPPADFSGAHHLHSWVRFFDFQLDMTGYGFFEFVGLLLLVSGFAYWLILRLTNRAPNLVAVQVHYWPTFLFGVFSVFLAHWVNRDPETTVNALNNRILLLGFNWIFVVILLLQFAFAVGAIRTVWRHRATAPNT